MNGDITVSSQPGRGTTFTIEIRTTSSDFTRRTSLNQEPTASCKCPQTKYSAMIVEDVYFNAEITRQLLGACNCFDVVKIAENGLVAVQTYEASILSGNPIRVITMDLEMPVMNGKDASKEIRQLEKKYRIQPCQLVIITGNCLDSEVSSCMNPNGEIRAQKFLRKPLRTEDFVSQMTSVCKEFRDEEQTKMPKDEEIVGDSDPLNVGSISTMANKQNVNTVSAQNSLEAIEKFKSTVDLDGL